MDYVACHKGTISEAELHVLRARLRGGILSKARRGELKTPLPVGLVYDAQGRVVLDPDRQVQDALRALFTTYERTGSGCATVRYFRDQGLLFPRRLRRGVRKGELVWGTLVHSRVLQVLHNPRYAGAFLPRPDSLVSESQWWQDLSATAARRVVCTVTRDPRGIHHLGTVPAQPAGPAGKRRGAGC